ncbi:hypothetical protein [Aeromonas hydrophila]|uniref:hypothetical protein n=1 Tax=Aeromonas hydrophila TaxID=644 RepID=UPI003EC790CF
MIAAGELYPAIANGLVGRDLELLADGGIGRFAGILITQGADARLPGHPVVGAPVLQGDGGARVAEQGGIEGLQQRLRLETGDGGVGPACGDAFLRLRGAMAQQGRQHHYSDLHVSLTLSTLTPDCNRERAEDHAFMPRAVASDHAARSGSPPFADKKSLPAGRLFRTRVRLIAA